MKFVAGLTSVFEPVVEVFKAVWEVISDIGGIFSDLWDLIKDPIMEIYNFFSELFGGGGGGFMDGVETAWQDHRSNWGCHPQILDLAFDDVR
jgi:hypothetical protein